MSQEVMQELLNIVDWCTSPGGTFINMFGGKKPPHVLPRFATDILVMQEVSCHISIGLSVRPHRRKKTPWPSLPLQFELYEIWFLNDVDDKAKSLENFEFDTKDYSLYDPHCICKNHCAKVYDPWIHKTFHWVENDPWR